MISKSQPEWLSALNIIKSYKLYVQTTRPPNQQPAAAMQVDTIHTMSKPTMKSSPLWRPHTAYLLILPSLLLFLFFFLYPILFSVYISTTNASFYNFIKGFNWIGLDNYKSLLLKGDFFKPLGRTLLFVLTSVPLKVIAGTSVAGLFSSPKLKLKSILYPLYLAPWSLPWFFVVMIWRGMFNQDFGAINQLLSTIGISSINWLNNPINAFISYNIVEVYLVYPFMTTIILAAIENIPREVLESAIIDGATAWERFRYIVLPLIQKPLLWATLITTIASYMIFGVPYILNKGGPAGINEFLLIYGYKKAFVLGRYGFASAFMVLVFFILIFLVIPYSKMTNIAERGY